MKPTRLIFLGLLASVLAGAGMAGDAGAQFSRADGPTPGSCPAGWTLDPLRAECYKCPPGFSATYLPLNPAACQRSATIGYRPATKYKRGTGLFALNCPAGQFRDWDGFCYACPPGFIRTATGIRDPAACAKPELPAFTAATRKPACPAGSFRDIGRGDCWKCPANSFRTAAPVDSDTACSTTIAGILGVNPRGVCSDVVRALDEGGDALARLQKTAEDLVSPVMTPVNEGMRQLAAEIRTPEEFDRLLERARPHMRPYRGAFEVLADLTSRVSKARDGLDRLMGDPEVFCNSDPARLNRALASLGLGPSGQSSTSALRGLAFDILRRPGGSRLDDSAQTKWPDFVTLGHRLDIITPYLVRITFSVTAVTNFKDHHGVFVSVGAALAPKEPSVGLEVSRSLLGFWNAEFSDFSGTNLILGVIPVGVLSAEISLSAGENVTDFFGRLRRMAWYPEVPSPSLAPLFIPDGLSWSFDPASIVKGPFAWGLGPSWTLAHVNRRMPERAAAKPTKLWVAPAASFDVSWMAFGR